MSEKQLKPLYSETETIASYLISLFYKSGKIYTASRSKINKLLIIHSLVNRKHYELLQTLYFDDGSIYNIVSYYSLVLKRDVYLNFLADDDGKPYTDEFNDNISIPNCFKSRINNYRLDDYTKELLEDIFRNFASYKLKDLLKQMNDLESLICKMSSNFIINCHIVFNSDDVAQKYRNNSVYNFIKEKVNQKDIDEVKQKRLLIKREISEIGVKSD